MALWYDPNLTLSKVSALKRGLLVSTRRSLAEFESFKLVDTAGMVLLEWRYYRFWIVRTI